MKGSGTPALCVTCPSSIRCRAGVTQITIPTSETKVIGWQKNPKYVKDEIEYLRSLMENDRAVYLSEILAQHDNAPFYWISTLGMTNGSKPLP